MNKTYIVFAHKYDNRTAYYLTLSKNDKETNKRIYGSIPCVFKKANEPKDGDIINIKEQFLSFYKKDLKTVPYVVVMNYEVLKNIND